MLTSMYMDCVRECAELSMQKAVDSVKSTPEYTANVERYLYMELAVVHDRYSEIIFPPSG